MLKRVTVGLGLLFCIASSLAAQQVPVAGISGLVRTADGLPVPGATLRLVLTANGRSWLSWTNEGGRFNLPGLPAGHYRMEVSELGFDTTTQEIDLGASAAPPLTILLKIATLQAIEQSAQQNQPATPASAAPSGSAPAAGAPSSVNPGSATSTNAPASRPGAGGRGYGNGRSAGQRGGAENQPGAGGFRRAPLGGQPGAPPGQPSDQVVEGIEGIDQVPVAGQEAIGDSSASDAILMAGTITRGADVSGAGGPPGGGFDGSGVPPGLGAGAPGISGPGENPGGAPGGLGGAGGVPGMNLRVGGAAQGRRGPGGRGGPPGAAALYGAQRVLRQRANQIHVSFYDQYSNSAFNAKPYSLTGINPPKIPTWSERTGGNVGGPLHIPHIYDGRDRTFFYVNFEGAWARNAVDQFSTVPTLFERQNIGNFCDRPTPPTLYVPANLSQPFVNRADSGCALPAGLINPAAQQILLNYFPAPNLPGFVDNYHLQARVPTQTNRLNMRVLHTFSPKLNARVIYNFSQSVTHNFQSFSDFNDTQSTRGQSLTLGLTQNLSRTWLNDTQLIFSRNRVLALNNFANVDNVAAALGVTGVSAAPLDWGVPQLSFTNYTGANGTTPLLTRNQTYRFVNAFTNSRSRHTIRGGVEIRRIENNTLSSPTPEGLFSFTNLMTANLDPGGNAVPGTGLDFASFLLGLPTTTNLRFGTVTNSDYYRSWGYVGYLTDDWRVKNNFTLEYGIRYEAFTPPMELYGHISNLVLSSAGTQAAVVIPGGPNPFGSPLPNSLVRGSYDNWAPRIGLAWRPPLQALSGKHATTVRAGYGLFYNESIYNQLLAELTNQAPWANSQLNLAGPAQTLTLQNGFPSSTPNSATNTYAVDPNYKLGYVQTWSLSVETALQTNTSLVITYTGTKGTHLDMLFALNRPAPGTTVIPVSNAGNFIYDTSGANSIYNGLQVRLQRRMSHGIMFNAIYTYGKSMDDASSIGGGSAIVVQNPANLAAERGLSSFDIRHQLRANYYYELPFGDRHRFAQNGLSAALFGNWRLSSNIAAHTGTPFTAMAAPSGTSDTGGGGIFAYRADQICNPNLPAGQRSPLNFFNTACFVAPPAGQFGDAARNTIEGPGMFTWNFQVSKWIPFGKDHNHRVDVRWEITNLTNTPNFVGLSTVVGSSTYGRVLGAGAMRTMDIMTRVNF